MLGFWNSWGEAPIEPRPHALDHPSLVFLEIAAGNHFARTAVVVPAIQQDIALVSVAILDGNRFRAGQHVYQALIRPNDLPVSHGMFLF
jgi:hypothetical protein